jgi:FkbM family methyltransferase
MLRFILEPLRALRETGYRPDPDSGFVAQNGEDRWVEAHWAQLGLPDRGFFVEVGAADGVTVSNTLWLEKTRDWSGLLVEADPRHEICHRPRSIVERAFVGPAGSVDFGLSRDPLLSGQLRSAQERIPDAVASERVRLPSIPLSSLLDRHGIQAVDLISIDTEGTEIEVWKTLDLQRWRPRVAIIELVTWGRRSAARTVVRQLAADGYRLVKRTRDNGIFHDVR